MAVLYRERGFMEEKEEQPQKIDKEEEKRREIDLNVLFPERGYDLNRLFPDEGTKKLLYELRRNKRDIDRFVRSLHVEEE
jgi:hypothetical protein